MTKSKKTFADVVNINNVAWEVSIDGGTVANFRNPGFGVCWINRVGFVFNLPETHQTTHNAHFKDILDGVIGIISDLKPFENIADDDIDLDELSAQITRDLLADYETGYIGLFVKQWTYRPNSHYIPLTITIRPTLRMTYANPKVTEADVVIG